MYHLRGSDASPTRTCRPTALDPDRTIRPRSPSRSRPSYPHSHPRPRPELQDDLPRNPVETAGRKREARVDFSGSPRSQSSGKQLDTFFLAREGVATSTRAGARLRSPPVRSRSGSSSQPLPAPVLILELGPALAAFFALQRTTLEEGAQSQESPHAALSCEIAALREQMDADG